MNQLIKKNNATDIIILLGIILIPFMSLPVMPSDYRPVSIFFLVPIAIVIYIKYLTALKMKKDIFILSLFVLFASIQSIILLGDFTKSIRNIAPLLIGFFSYIAINYYFIRNELEKIYGKFIKLFVFIAFLGLFEILSMYGILPYSIKEIIGELFSAKISSRVQLITMEGSWAAKIIIFSLPIYMYYYCTNGYFYKSFYALLLLFFMIFSLEGFAIVLVAFMIYFIYRLFPITIKFFTFKYKIKSYLYLLLLIVVFASVIQIIFTTQSGYAISRIYKFLDADSFLVLLSLDGSTFIRVVYPFIGFQIFVDHPFGIGLGGYAEAFNHYVQMIDIDYSKFLEVTDDIKTVSADPKSLYAKIVSETGIVGIGLFLYFVVLQIRYLKVNIVKMLNYRLFFISNFLLGMVSVIQFGSFAYLPFWFAFAVNSAVYYKNLKEFEI